MVLHRGVVWYMVILARCRFEALARSGARPNTKPWHGWEPWALVGVVPDANGRINLERARNTIYTSKDWVFAGSHEEVVLYAASASFLYTLHRMKEYRYGKKNSYGFIT